MIIYVSIILFCAWQGLPLHVQIDTFDVSGPGKEAIPVSRGYCQIKVFCDKVNRFALYFIHAKITYPYQSVTVIR